VDKGPEGPDRRRPRLRPTLIRSLVGLVGAYAATAGVLLVLLAFPVRNRAKVREKGAGNGTESETVLGTARSGDFATLEGQDRAVRGRGGHRRRREPGSLTGAVEDGVPAPLPIVVSV
jgi:hypothetical protein